MVKVVVAMTEQEQAELMAAAVTKMVRLVRL